MWLFHFRSGGEFKTKSKSNAEGIGHAVRCLRVRKTAERKFGIKSCVVVNSNKVSRALLKTRGVDIYFDESVLHDDLFMQGIEVVVTDINYLDSHYFDLYSKHSISVCLAPRGIGKYLADIAFKDIFFSDANNAHNSNIYSGLEYVVTGDRFSKAREKIVSGRLKKDARNIIISMGGLDQFDMTSSAVTGLIGLPEQWNVKIIIGPVYQYVKQLTKKVKKLNCSVEIIRDPYYLYDIMASSNFGIFGSGIVSYEGIGLGLTCLNVSHSDFHRDRAEELESLGVGIYAGDASRIKEGDLCKLILKSLNNEKVEAMRKKGMNLVDNNGADRIIRSVINCLSDEKNKSTF